MPGLNEIVGWVVKFVVFTLILRFICGALAPYAPIVGQSLSMLIIAAAVVAVGYIFYWAIRLVRRLHGGGSRWRDNLDIGGWD